MDTQTIHASNIKCQGCANAIREGLSVLPGVESVEVNIEGSQVTVQGASLQRELLTTKLAEIGYPESDT